MSLFSVADTEFYDAYLRARTIVDWWDMYKTRWFKENIVCIEIRLFRAIVSRGLISIS